MFCPGACWDQGLNATAAYFYCYNYAVALELPGVPPARGARAVDLRTLADDLVIDCAALAAQLRKRLGGEPSEADVEGVMVCLDVRLSAAEELSQFAAAALTSKLVGFAYFEGARELQRRADKYLPKINDAWRAVGFPGIGDGPPSWPDENDRVMPGIGGSRDFRAAMNAARGVPLLGVAWMRAAAPAPALFDGEDDASESEDEVPVSKLLAKATKRKTDVDAEAEFEFVDANQNNAKVLSLLKELQEIEIAARQAEAADASDSDSEDEMPVSELLARQAAAEAEPTSKKRKGEDAGPGKSKRAK